MLLAGRRQTAGDSRTSCALRLPGLGLGLLTPVPHPVEPALRLLFLHLQPGPVNTQASLARLEDKKRIVHDKRSTSSTSTFDCFVLIFSRLQQSLVTHIFCLLADAHLLNIFFKSGSKKGLNSSADGSFDSSRGRTHCFTAARSGTRVLAHLHLGLLSCQRDVEDVQGLFGLLKDRCTTYPFDLSVVSCYCTTHFTVI